MMIVREIRCNNPPEDALMKSGARILPNLEDVLKIPRIKAARASQFAMLFVTHSTREERGKLENDVSPTVCATDSDPVLLW